MSTNYIDQITDTAGTTHDISEGDSTRIFRATCATAAATAAKVATLQTSDRNFSLATGVRVAVTFTYGNSAATPTLNVNSSGAKTIAVATSATAKTTGNGTTYNTWGPYETVLFTYDGTYWVNGGSGRSIYHAYNSTGTDTKVTQAYSTTDNSYPLLATATAGISSTSSRGATTAILNNQMYVNPYTGTISATYFNGTASATTAYTTANLKNIVESTNAPGTASDYPTGTVWLQYGTTPPSDRADYVIEQGTSGIWTYRKWNSGIAECWGTSEVSNLAITTTWGSLKYGTLSAISFPSNLFNAAPNLTIFLRSTAGRVWATQTTNLSSSTTGTIYAIAPGEYSAGSTTINVVMTAIGTWK